MTPDEAINHIKSSKSLWDLHHNLCALEQSLASAENEWRDSDHDGEGGYWWENHHEFDTENFLKSHGLDICELPTFGGKEPQSTIEVWSWDEDSLLVGTGSFKEWEIVSRKSRIRRTGQ